jgi:putative phosphoesterase
MDSHHAFQSLPVSRVVDAEGRKILITHRVGRPEHPHPEVQERLLQVRPDVVVFGHTHHPFNRMVSGILFFNPGTAGKRQFGSPLTFGFLEIDGGQVTGRIVQLYHR